MLLYTKKLEAKPANIKKNPLENLWSILSNPRHCDSLLYKELLKSEGQKE